MISEFEFAIVLLLSWVSVHDQIISILVIFIFYCTSVIEFYALLTYYSNLFFNNLYDNSVIQMFFVIT
jgi:hypothetical protein